MYYNPEILEAVKHGAGSNEGDLNPYKPEEKRKHAGWQAGYKRAREEDAYAIHWNRFPWWRRALCSIGLHKHEFKNRVPGRPHINPTTSMINGRDDPIFIYECHYCLDRVFGNLCGSKIDQDKRRKEFRKRRSH